MDRCFFALRAPTKPRKRVRLEKRRLMRYKGMVNLDGACGTCVRYVRYEIAGTSNILLGGRAFAGAWALKASLTAALLLASAGKGRLNE